MKLFRSAHKERGTTIIELLIYMGVLSVFLVVLSQIFTTLLDSMLESQAVSYTDQDVRYVYSRLAYDVQRADTINLPASNGQSGSTLELVISGVTYTYSLSGDKLVVTSGGQTESLVGFGSRVTGVTFTRLGSTGGKDTIQLDAQLESEVVTSHGTETRRLTTTFGTR